MSRRLLDEGSEGPISPLIDVVMNGMAAMFIILMVYLFVARPDPGGKPEPLRFLGEVAPPAAVAGQSYTFTLPVAGGTGARSFAADGDLPQGIALDAETGTLFGIPAAVPGERRFDLSVLARDAKYQDRRDATLRVYPAVVPHDPEKPAFSIVRRTEDLPAGRVGVDYESVLGARGGVEPLAWRLSGGSLPRGLALADGRIAGVPGEDGVFDLTVELKHSAGSFTDRGQRRSWLGGSTERRFRLRILGELRTSFEPPVGRVGEPYSASIAAGALLPGEDVQWQGEVPGVVLSPAGALSGRPIESKSFPLSYAVVRGSRSLASGSAEVRILPPRPARQVGPARIVGRAGEDVRFPLAYRGLREPVSVRWLATWPAGLRAEDGVVAGRPETPGRTRLPFEVTDALGQTLGGELDLEVRPPMTPLAVSAPPVLDVVVGEPQELQLAAHGGEGGYRWETAGLPPGLEASERGRIAGRLAEPGSWKVDLTVHDPASGESARQTVTVRGRYAESSPLRWATTAVPAALVGRPFDLHLAVAGGVGEPAFELEGDLPAGLEFSPDGIRGTPVEPGKTEIVARVHDAAGQSAAPAHFEVVIEAAENTLPTLSSAKLPPALAGRKYELDFAAEGGMGRYSWLFEGNLPPGLTFDERGIRGVVDPGFSGGVFLIQPQVTDALGRKTSQAYYLEVLANEPWHAEESGPPSSEPSRLRWPWWILAVAVPATAGLFFFAGKRSGRREERFRIENQFRTLLAAEGRLKNG